MQYKPIRFRPGTVYVTRAVSEMLSQQRLLQLLQRHIHGDWGDTCKSDRAANEQAIGSGDRILSWYQVSGKIRILIITEADRSATTIMLSDEY